jgi:kynurenine 3-monooxygenase
MANSNQKYVVVGAGPVGSLAALYAAKRGYQVEIYELRSGEPRSFIYYCNHLPLQAEAAQPCVNHIAVQYYSAYCITYLQHHAAR